jgi:hypothetical protein
VHLAVELKMRVFVVVAAELKMRVREKTVTEYVEKGR